MRVGALELGVILLVVIALLLLVMVQRRRRGPLVVLADIFDEPLAPNPGPKARAWASSVLDAAGIDPRTEELEAMRLLRQAEPRLTLDAARALVRALA